MTSNKIDEHTYLARTVKGRWTILIDGIQWSPLGEPRDASGAGSATWPAREDALQAFKNNEAFIRQFPARAHEFETRQYRI